MPPKRSTHQDDDQSTSKKHKQSPKEVKLLNPEFTPSSYVHEMPTETTTTTTNNDIGTYDQEQSTWVWDLENNTRLSVKTFQGRTNVDIRKMWNNAPTKKGVSMSLETFKRLQQWKGLDDALKAIKK